LKNWVYYEAFDTDISSTFLNFNYSVELLKSVSDRYRQDGLQQIHLFGVKLISHSNKPLFTHLLIDIGPKDIKQLVNGTLWNVLGNQTASSTKTRRLLRGPRLSLEAHNALLSDDQQKRDKYLAKIKELLKLGLMTLPNKAPNVH